MKRERGIQLRIREKWKEGNSDTLFEWQVNFLCLHCKKKKGFVTERHFKGPVTAQNPSGDKIQVSGIASQGKLYIFIAQVTVR